MSLKLESTSLHASVRAALESTPHVADDVTSDSFTLLPASGMPLVRIEFTYDPSNAGADAAGRDPARLFMDLGSVRLVYVCTTESTAMMREVSRVCEAVFMGSKREQLAEAVTQHLHVDASDIEVLSFHNAIAPSRDGADPQMMRCIERPRPRRYTLLAARDRLEKYPDETLRGAFVWRGMRVQLSNTRKDGSGEQRLILSPQFSVEWDFEALPRAPSTSMSSTRLSLRPAAAAGSV